MTDERIATDAEVEEWGQHLTYSQKIQGHRRNALIARIRAADAIRAAFRLAPVLEYVALDEAYNKAIAGEQADGE